MQQYLTEERLKNLTKLVFNSYETIFNKKLNKTHFIPDIYIPEKNLIVEFDGYRHFSDAKTIIRDIRLDKYAEAEKIEIVHVPYFVQVDTKTFSLIFKEALAKEIKSFIFSNYSYPQGFIDKKAMLPANYCYLGIQRFKASLEYFSTIEPEIYRSLDSWIRIGKHSWEVYSADHFQNKYLVLDQDASEDPKDTIASSIDYANCEINAALAATLSEHEENEELIKKTVNTLEENLKEIDEGISYTALQAQKDISKASSRIYIIDLEKRRNERYTHISSEL